MIGGIITTPIICVTLVLVRAATGKSTEICRTAECIKAAGTILGNMDCSVNPCQDFYRFACGGFINRTVVPEDRHMWTATSDMELTVLKRIAETFNSSSNTEVRPRYFRIAQNFYKSCMNEEAIEENGLEGMKQRLELLGGWPVLDEYGVWDEDDFDWVNTTVLLMDEGWSSDMLVDLCIGTDARNNSRSRLQISQADLGIPREYLVQGLTNEIVQTYFELMVEVAMEFGAPLKFATEELSDVLMFEIELSKISVPQEEMRDHFRLNNPISLFELEEQFPLVNWSVLIPCSLEKYVVVSPEEVVDVVVPSYFQKLGPLVERVDKRVVANYIMWHVVYESLPFLPKRVSHIRRKLMVALTGAKRFRPRWEFCTNSLLDRFEPIVGAIYVRKYFKPKSKKQATQMVTFIQKEFLKLISEVSWLSKETKHTAIKKASNIFHHVGYPEELLDDVELDRFYKKMEMTNGDLIRNLLAGQQFESYRAFSELHRPFNQTRWDLHAEVTEVNAYYVSDQNSIEIPAGILQGLFYSPDRPNYLNFGALGYVIAHELLHSVDDEGKQYDSRGNLHNWWDRSTQKEFDKRANELVREYSSYVVPEVNMTLKGVNIQGEVIADHGGLKVAYNAYHTWASRHPPEPGLPQLEHFSANQLFWLSAANSWCTKEREESLRLGVMVDVHPPSEFRINGPFRHSSLFAQDWKCPPGSFMNLPNKYNVW
ncbi:neprilysin-2-like [Homalodisca vitripennis]|uniref:neprilysin-2-like n=1 Tax=Homalodisca vitripennis TaxID=197043 RepID=UPI001EECE1A6|nr:neprilysin-2-like [Homalodisca vitripennis]